MRKLKYLLGEGAYPPLENVDIYLNDKMGIFVPKGPIWLPEGTHTHSSYEFTVPVSLSPLLQLEKRKVHLERNKIFTFNSEHEHGTIKVIDSAFFFSLQVNRDFVQDMAYQVYGRRDIEFNSECYVVDNELLLLVKTYIDEFKYKQLGYHFILEGLCVQIMVSLFRGIENNMRYPANERNYYERKSIDRTIEYMKENYNSDYSMEDVAQYANMSPYHFIRVFKNLTGKTPYEYLMDIKINMACGMLKDNKMTCTEIGYSCGFNNSSHFSTVFRKKMGLPPSEYRKNF